MSIRQFLHLSPGVKSRRSRCISRRSKRGKQRRQFAIEKLEDRCLLTFISVTVTFVNQSNNTLTFLGGHASHGTFTNPLPPDSIAPGGSATWETESNGVGTGTEATATYQIGSDPTLQTTLHWDDPTLDSNSFDESAPAGYVAHADGPAHGNNIDAHFSITLNLAGRGYPLNSTSWTAIDPGAIFTTPGPNDSNGASPNTVSGRVTGLAVDSTYHIIYAATAGGGVWKNVSNSAGNTPDSPLGNSSGDWVPLTDNLSDAAGNPIPEFMGAIAVAPSNHNVIYAGTGEANNSGDSYWGEGVLVSQNGGLTWTLTGQALLQGTAISQIVIDPQDPNTAWVAVSNTSQNGNSAATTGIFKTTNGGTSWIKPTAGSDVIDPWSALVIDPTTTTAGGGQATLFAAVGNQFGSAKNGVYRSPDSGTTWTLVNGTNISSAITLVTNSVNPTIVTSSPHGLVKGQSVVISGVLGAVGVNGTQVVASVTPNSFTITLPTAPGGYTSGGSVNGSGRIALSLSRPAGAAAATVYTSIATANNAGSSTLEAFEVSTDGGTIWTPQTSTPNYLTKLGWYGNVILADPNTPATVYAVGAGGGNTMFESTNSGANWTSIDTDSNGVNPHADHHALAIDGTGRLLDGNDGGVWRLNSNNLPSFAWEDLNGWETVNAPGLSINQISGIALSPAGSQLILSGSQDNGTNVFRGGQSGTFASAWTNVAGNDGGFVRIDPTDTNPSNPITGFTEYQLQIPATGTLNSFQRFDDLRSTNPPTDISAGVSNADNSDFYAPYVIDPNNPQRLVLGTNKLYATPDQGTTAWSAFGNQPSFPTTTYVIDSIAIAASDPTSKTIYIGASDSAKRSSYRLFVTTDGGTTWTNRTPAIALPLSSNASVYGTFMQIAVSPSSSTTAYVGVAAFTGGNAAEVWQTTDAGAHWTDITGTGLPSVPIDSIALVPGVNTLIVGTDVGIYGTGSVNGATTAWYRVGTGLPNVQVTDLQSGSYSDTGAVVAAGTHGRGVWEIQVTKVSVAGNVLILSGSDLGGSFGLQLKPGDPSTLQVFRGSTLINEVPASSVNRIQVNGVGGSNSLIVDFSNGNAIPSGGIDYDGGTGVSGTLILKGQLPGGAFGTETDTPTGPHSGTIGLDGSQIRYTNLKPIIDTVPATNFTITGSANADQINIVNDPNGTENGFQATEVISASFEKVDFANKVNVTVDGLGGANTFLINNPNPAAGLIVLSLATGPTAGSVVNVRATGTAVTTRILGDATITVNVGSLAPATGGTLDSVKGHLILSDTASAGALNVDDTGGNANRTGTLTASTLVGLGMVNGITYSGVQTLNIGLGSGNDTLNVQSTSAVTTVDANAGNDGFNVGSLAPATGGVLDRIQAALILHGNGGVNTATFDDSGDFDFFGQSGTLTATQLTGESMANGITYSGLQTLNIGLGSGNDIFNVQSTSAVTTVNANAGDDVFNVGSLAPATGGILSGIQAALTLIGNGGINTILFDDSGDLVGRTGTLTPTQLTGLGMGAAITFSGLAMLQVNLGTKDDILTITYAAGNDIIYGGAGDDLIYGGPGNDTIYGDAGDDTIHGGAGNDVIHGGTGNDTIYGDAGDDTIHGDAGDDYIEGNDGNDQLFGDAGRDVIYGSAGNDTISGGDDEDVLYGGTGDDVITGDGGADRIYGEDGNDTLSGGLGDDLIYGGPGNDLIHGDDGNDQLDGGAGVDIIHGDNGDDLIFGGGGVGDQLFGDAGNDTIYGSDDGSEDPNFADNVYFGDIIDGGPGDDIIYGLGGADIIHGGDGNDTIDGGANGDLIYGDAGNDIIYGGLGDDQLHGGDGNDKVYGQQGADTITGDAGDDILDGGTGADSLSGGDGNDELFGGGGTGDVLHGDAGDDILRGSNDGADMLFGDAGRDRLYGNGGNDTLSGGLGDDLLDGGAGDDTLSGDAGSDVLIGGAGNDVLYGQNATDSGDDNAVDYLYGDFGTNGNEAGSGGDQLFGQGGNDLLFGEGGDDFIADPQGGNDVIDFGAGDGATPNNFIPPSPTPPPTLNSIDIDRASATLAQGIDDRGRWAELAGSATGLGISGAGLALDPAVAASSVTGQFVAWADARNGNFEIYVARHGVGSWQELSASAHDGGISNTLGSSRRPSLVLDPVSGQPIVAWTETTAAGTDIYVAKFDPTANAGAGGWIALGNSFSGGGISGTGAADQATLLETSAGLVIVWLDTSSGLPQAYARQFVGGVWQSLGAGGASGGGISASVSGVSDVSAATDGTKVAVTWSQTAGSNREIYLREYSGGSWNELAGSASGGGVSQSAGDSDSPTVAYLSGSLFAAWRDQTLGRSNVYAARFTGGAWQPAGVGAMSNGGLTNTLGQSLRPKLASGGGALYLSWIEDRSLTPLAATADPIPDLTVSYVKRWNGASFAEEIGGDASFGGVSASAGVVQAQSLMVDDAGHAQIAWQDATSGTPEIYFRANLITIGTVYYVNDGSTVGDSLTTAAGSSGNTGLTATSPKASIQQVLDAYSLHAGNVILVDAGTYAGGVTVSASDAGISIIGAGDRLASIQGLVTVSADSVILDRLNLAGGVSSAANNLTLHNSQVAGAGLTLSGGTGAQVSENLFTAATTNILLSGAVQQATIEDNQTSGGTVGLSITAPSVAGLEFRDNVMSVSGTGIALSATAAGHIARNDVTAATTDLSIAAAFTGLIEANALHGATTGVNYAAAAALGANRIFGNSTGVVATVAGNVNGLGFVGATIPNEISANTIGVQLTGQMQNQHVFDNTTGVTGSGVLGGGDLDHANLIETNVTGASFTGSIQFNRIAGNQLGIAATSNQLIAHNLIYRNAQQGILISGKSNVQIVSNTLYSPTGDQIRIDGSSSNIEVRDDILWSEAGYDLYVANDSTSGYFSDYNDLHASGTGKLVYWTRDFTDILDWQQDVAQFDLHSIGTTRVNPLWSQPQFDNRGWDDYRTFDQSARQRLTSPTIDAGDPLTDLAQPSYYQNLLVNSGFESGLTGWTASPSGGTQNSAPAPFAGGAYFTAQSNGVATVEQTIDVSAQAAAIDSQNLVAVYGGRVRSVAETTADRGQITITFLNSVGGTIKQSTVLATNVSDRWELIGERLTIPAGTRQINYRFTATRQSGTTNDSYLDGAFVYVEDSTVAPNLGAYGNTTAELSQNVATHLVLRSPDLYTDWLRDAPLKIRWDSFGNSAGAPIQIDLYQDTPQGPQFVLHIATTTDTGQYAWIAGNSGVDYGTFGLRVQVSLLGNATVFSRSTEAFAVPENSTTFFVNDFSTANDEYTTAVGDDRNTGRTASHPKPYLNNVLRIYTLGPGQTVKVDSGSYPELYPTLISNVAGLGDDAGFTVTGPTGSGHAAQLTHANPLTVAPLIELSDADFVAISYLSLTGGQYGMLVHNGSTNLSVGHVSITGAALDGLRDVEASNNLSLDHVTTMSSGGSGIYIDSIAGSIRGSISTGNVHHGLYLNNPGAVSVESSEFAANGDNGIYVSSTNGLAVIGNSDLSLAAGNRIHDNAKDGIDASGQVLVTGNVVYGQLNANRYGILLQGGSATRNVVHDNTYGIYSSSSANNVDENRAYHNTLVGIFDYQGSSIQRNVAYSNPIGIQTGYYFRGPVANNLVYANSLEGILVQSAAFAGGTVDLINNTVYQLTGDAVRIDSGSSYIRLRNNILWVLAGFDLSVASDSQIGFASDYNLLYVTGAGQTALWQGVARPTLLAWQNADFTDANSIAQTPQFVDIDGADNLLGFASAANDGRDDDFHEQSQFGSFHGGALAPVLSLATGLPISLIATQIVDALQSPAIDRGDPSDSATLEPAPDGEFVNLGTYGGTAQASLSPSHYVIVARPDGGEAWPASQTFPIRWRTENLDPNNPVGVVTIQLLKAGAVVQTLAAGAPNNGTFSWAIPAGTTPGTDYTIRVTRGVDVDTSNATFTITAPVHIYYVNDATVIPGDWTSQPGSDSNDGLSSATPKASIRAVLDAYHLIAGDVIRVDSGAYALAANIVVTSDDDGVKIEGYHDPGFPSRHAIVDRGNASSGSYAFELQNADAVTLDNLWITNAYSGVFASGTSDSDNVTLSNDTIYGNNYAGIEFNASNDNLAATGNNIYGVPGGATSLDDQSFGLYMAAAGSTVSLNQIHDTGNYGVYLLGSPTGLIANNQVFNNRYGIYVNSYSSLSTDQVRIDSNTVTHNSVYGITASGPYLSSLLVQNNVVFGQVGVNTAGIALTTGEASSNLVFDNFHGIIANGTSLIHDNRLYHNAGDGLGLDGPTQAYGNRIYNNAVGVETGYYFTGQIRNNVIYANSLDGILDQTANGQPHTVINNTIYQTGGSAIRLQGSTSNLRLSNNIFWVEGGYAISVAPDSEAGFASDYNLFYLTAGAKLGQWENRDFANRVDWFFELGFDAHSLNGNPLFANPAGPDGILGYSTAPTGSAQIIDNGDPGYASSGTWVTTSASGYQSDIQTNVTSNAGDTATWTFTGLTPGATYQLAITYPADNNNSNFAPFSVVSGGATLATANVDQRVAPNDFSASGTGWKTLGLFYVTSDTLQVQLGTYSSTQVVADAVRLQAIASDRGADDDFHVVAGSPAVDGGDPTSPYRQELAPNGDRADIGAYGNTSEALLSPPQLVQVLSPNGQEKFKQGQQVPINWRSAGLTTVRPVALIGAGATVVNDNWSPDVYRTSGNISSISASTTIDTSGVANPAPSAVYHSYAYAASGVGNSLSYQIPVPDGDYTVRLHFVEYYYTTPGNRNIDIKLQGTLAQHNFDIFTAAGARFKVVAVSLPVTATGGKGIAIDLVNLDGGEADLQGIEVRAANPSGVANPLVDLQYSSDGGGTWQPIATGLTMDHWGRGTYNWTIPAGLAPGANFLVRVVATTPSGATDASDQPFLIASAGHDYYVNDNSTVGDEFTTAVGNNANSGKAPGQPMASLFALLAAYDLDPGDVVHVDTGNYSLIQNITIGASDSGVTIQGPAIGQALLDRGNTASGSYAIEMTGADDVTLDRLSITGAYDGVHADTNVGSDRLTINRSTIFANSDINVLVNSGNNQLTVSNSTLYGRPTGSANNDNTGFDLYLVGDNATISGNTIYDAGAYGIFYIGPHATITGNRVFDNGSTGIYINVGGGTPQSVVSGNVVFNNGNVGMNVSGHVLVSGNTVYDQTNATGGIGIYLNSAEAAGNIVSGNAYGIYSAGGTYVHDNHVSRSGVAALYAYSTDRLISNRVDDSAVGVLLGYYFNGELSNNLIYGSTQYGIRDQAAAYVHPLSNNTVYQATGVDLQIDGGSNYAHVENNIFWTDSGTDVVVAADSETGHLFDYNQYAFGPTGKLGQWQGQNFTALADWYWQTGQDQHSRLGDPQFVSPAGPDGVLGFSAATLAPAQFIDNGDAGFSTTGTWSNSNTTGYQGDYQSAASGLGASTASWAFGGLAAGTYQVAITYPTDTPLNLAGNAPFDVFDGATWIGRVRVNQYQAPNSFTDAGANWLLLGYFHVTSGALTVRLSDGASSIVLADAVRIQQISGDRAADDNFRVTAGSPTIDAGDPLSYYLSEPAPNGGRVNLGYTGNSSLATTSPVQIVQVLSPNGNEKLEQGQVVPVSWQTNGLTSNQTVALVDAGGSGSGVWGADRYGVNTVSTSTNANIDLSGVTNPAPLSVYQSYAYVNSGPLSYRLPVPDGDYILRLHFIEPDYSSTDQRKFDVELQNVVRQAGFDIYAAAGGRNKAVTLSIPVTVSGGGGLSLDLVAVTSALPILSGIELTAASPLGAAGASADVQVSADGGANWLTLATSQPLDATGRGSFNWTVPAGQPEGNNYLIRVVSHNFPTVSDVSDAPFLVTNGGHDYYVNDASPLGDQFTTALGNNANSGKSPGAPMLTLQALLDAYDLDPGDVIHVDAGTYTLLRNITIGSQDSGVKIEGPATGAATLQRANVASTNYCVVELQNADNVTFSRLSLTGAVTGIYAANGSDSDGFQLLNSKVYGNRDFGLNFQNSNDGLTISGTEMYGIAGDTNADDQTYSVYLLSNNDVSLVNNTIHESGYYGIFVSGGLRTLVQGNLLYGNRIGAYVGSYDAAPNQAHVIGNTAHDNGDTGLYLAGSGVVATGNTAFNQHSSNGIGIYSSNSVVQNNIVYSNNYGISDQGGSLISGNRVFNNSAAGILLNSTNTQVLGNEIYSNSIGIRTGYYFTGLVANNVVYANTNQGFLIQSPYSVLKDIVSNTIYQPVGDAIRIDSGAANVRLRDNIIWVESGYDLYVATDSQSGVESDYNLLHQGIDPNAHVGFWGGAARDLLADWQAASGLDANSVAGDPLFVDRDGADNILGYAQVNGVFVDGGADDNFYRVKNSPATDRGDGWFAAATDRDGFGRFDDPGTPNAGRNDYVPAVQSTSQFAVSPNDVATGFRSNNTYFPFTLPFAFPFYDGSYSTVYISTEGMLQFSDPTLAYDNQNSAAALDAYRRIAPLWDDIRTNGTGDDIFINTSVANQVTIRWNATNEADSSDVQFSVTLFSNGQFRFDYGPGNTNLTPTVGVAFGNSHTESLVPGYDGAASLTSANSVLWTQQPGYADIGAYEFRGSSLDVTPPTIVGSTPAGVHAGSSTSGAVNQIQLALSEEVNPIDAMATANYELRNAGPDALFGSNDDTVIALTPSYTLGGTSITLGIPSGSLAAGTYRLTVTSNAGGSLHDLAGIALDGDANGSPLGNYVRTFAVVVNPIVTNTNDSGPGSLRQALADAAALSGPTRTVLFAIPAGPQTINLLSPLPPVSFPVTLSLDETQNVVVASSSGTSLNNNGTLTLSGTGTLTVRAGIEGTGNLVVNTGSNLTANHINESALVIGGTSTSFGLVTIAASDASGNPLTLAAAMATDSTIGSPQLAAPAAASPSAVAIASTASILTAANTTASTTTTLPIPVADAPTTQVSSGLSLAAKRGFNDSAGLIARQAPIEIVGLSNLSNSMSMSIVTDWGSSLSAGVVYSTSDQATSGGRQATATKGTGGLLRSDAVAAAFDDADILEWLGPTDDSRPSATDAETNFLGDDLLAAIGQQWRK